MEEYKQDQPKPLMDRFTSRLEQDQQVQPLRGNMGVGYGRDRSDRSNTWNRGGEDAGSAEEETPSALRTRYPGLARLISNRRAARLSRNRSN